MDIKKAMIFILNGALLGSIAGAVAQAQILAPTEEFEKQYRPPLDLQGQIVSLHVVPAAENIKVFVSGVPADQLQISDVGLRAYVRTGEGFLPVTSSKEGDYFIVGTPLTGQSNLKLDVNYKGKTETFDVAPGK